MKRMLLAAACLGSTALWAQPGTTQLDTLQVTASRTGENTQQLPAMLSVVQGEDLRARGATTLSQALAGVAGVEISPGGDNGPAGSVPALWGLREFDAFLLVVDGVPAGGAFNPALTTLDMSNVQRIEVLRGSAPVMYGATSFVGVIHVIHYPAGQAPDALAVRVGGPSGAADGVVARASASWGAAWQQSLSLRHEDRDLADTAAGLKRTHVLYRGAADWAGGQLHVDLDLVDVDQRPDSPVLLTPSGLNTQAPLDANHNPADARLSETRYQLNAGYQRALGQGRWSSLVSLAKTDGETLRGYLADADSGAAAGYDQQRKISDLYLDSHWSLHPTATLDTVLGVDALIGEAKQNVASFQYQLAPDGGARPPRSSASPLKAGEGDGERFFTGVYLQNAWHVNPRVDVLAGLRLNLSEEKRDGEREEDIDGDGMDEEIIGAASESMQRLSGMLGVSWQLLQCDAANLRLFADYRDTFKPAAYEFGPEAESAIPEAETARSWEAGFKLQLLDGRMDVETAWFDQDFRNVFLLEGNDIRRTRLRGAELEAHWALAQHLQLVASYAYHRARFVDARINDGAQEVSGNALQLAPENLASLGLIYQPQQGLFGNALFSHVGQRYLDKANSAQTPAYNTLDASIGYQMSHTRVMLSGHNLGDRRDPVSASEFGEVLTGQGQYYRLPARSVTLSVDYDFG